MTSITWVHDDCLFRFGDGPAIYVWDDEYLRSQAWTLKKIGFVYECLLELPVEIRRGDTLTEVRRFAQEHETSHVITMQTPDPRLTALAKSLKAEVIAPEPFVHLSGTVNLRRFSQYWRKAEPVLFPGK